MIIIRQQEFILNRWEIRVSLHEDSVSKGGGRNLNKLISTDALQLIGLVVVVMYIVVGFDDIVWDVVTFFRRLKHPRPTLEMSKLDEIPPKLLAVVIGAWKEDNVLGDVVDNIIASAIYPKSMYHIFLGVYPNDERTLAVAHELAARHNNVYVIVNLRPGPTSKAQNINHTIHQVRLFEQERNWCFASITVHDAEDVVHPYEFKMTNYLIDHHKALQFPVFPLVPMPTFRNFFKFLTSSTYADEFAETHFYTMVNRHSIGALVPSAGTGFVLSRGILEQHGSHGILPVNSLTEDYLLSWKLFSKGIQMHFVLEGVNRVDYKNKPITEFVATRSMFPNSFKTAVKQKARWILGITMQSLGVKDVLKVKNVSLAGRYSLYKDQKAKYGNLLVMIGYPVLAYFIASLFLDLPAMYPKESFAWKLCILVTFMMIVRQTYRAIAIYNVYGMRSVFFACLLPPFLPIRLLWGNFINLAATLSAFRQKWFGNQKKTTKKLAAPGASKKLVWDKTDHSFLEKYILERYHRSLGDILLEKNYLDKDTLAQAIEESKKRSVRLGDYLIHSGLLTETQLLKTLATIKHVQYVDKDTLAYYPIQSHRSIFDERTLRELLALPLLKTEEGYVFAFCEASPIYAQSILRNNYRIKITAVFGTKELIQSGLEQMFSEEEQRSLHNDIAEKLYAEKVIDYEQFIILSNYKSHSNRSERELLKYMGFLPEENFV